MFTYAKLVLTLLQVAKMLVSLAERNNWIAEGERRALLRETMAVNKAMKVALKVRAEVDKMTDEEVLAALAADGDLLDP